MSHNYVRAFTVSDMWPGSKKYDLSDLFSVLVIQP
jgi:hypothetical protein